MNWEEANALTADWNKYVLKVALPQDWIMSEKSLATEGAIPRARVITGNATAPPPSEVMPETKRGGEKVKDDSLKLKSEYVNTNEIGNVTCSQARSKKRLSGTVIYI